MLRPHANHDRDDHHGGELIYLSQRKLAFAAQGLGLDQRPLSTEFSAEGTVRLAIPLPPVLKLSAEVTGSAKRNGPDWETIQPGLLRSVVAALADRGMDDIDDGPRSVAQGHWFTFHRDLLFGIGSSDTNQAVRAFVLVDDSPVEQDGITPGLMLHGGPEHVFPPYRDDAIATPGGRSGSGTERLFVWARKVIETVDQAPAGATLTDLEAELLEGRTADEHRAVNTMYRHFSGQSWLTRIPQLQSFGRCQGIARANLVSSTDGGTVIVGSPLYVQLVPRPSPISEAEVTSKPGLLNRILGRSQPRDTGQRGIAD